MKEQRRRYRERNLEKEKARIRRTELGAKYGITPAEYGDLSARQGGRCAICANPETATRGGRTIRLAVDHDHATGQRRALLCSACNRALGLMKDDPTRLRLAASYLEIPWR